ncbi:bcl-2 homologous antagonist/killer-like [Amphiura filiformis]|uniref:bcl-2 homologous antagonist/killer-like n=1 Tax=Amphiura filiformis TaxID=82378 RepID=UPI003B223920
MATGGRTSTETLTPDTEDNVIEHTEEIVRSFMYQRLQMDMQHERSDIAISTPRLPEFQVNTSPLSSTSQVGRRLAEIGDQINDRYEGEFRSMIQHLHITPSTAYQAFAGVARKLFTQGINWGRIAALLMFGYRIALDVSTGVGEFLNKIVQALVRFIVGEKIASWIAEQGGWRSILTYQFQTYSWVSVGVVAALATVTVLAIYYNRR